MKHKLRSRCFPIEYYSGKILTEVEARRNRKIVSKKLKILYISIIFGGTIGGGISPYGAVGLPAPSPIDRIQTNNLDLIGAQKNQNLRYAQIFDNYVYQNDSIEELYDITSKFLNTDMSIEELELILKLWAGGRVKGISWIIFYI